jgi:hypothetical protein
MVGNEVKVSNLLRQHLIDLVFPLTGQVTIQDSRVSCDDQPGPCSVTVEFHLDLVQYEVPCPDDLLRFTAENGASVQWTAPVVRKLSGLSQTLSGSYTPGSNMALGKTLVEYAFPMHPSQQPATSVSCSFTVRNDLTCIYSALILFIHQVDVLRGVPAIVSEIKSKTSSTKQTYFILDGSGAYGMLQSLLCALK